jgi:hypothetical protein
MYSTTLYYLPLSGAQARESDLKADALLTHELTLLTSTQTQKSKLFLTTFLLF